MGAKAPTSLDHLDAWKSPDPWILDLGKTPILDSGPEAKAVTSLDDLDYLENSDPWILDNLCSVGALACHRDSPPEKVCVFMAPGLPPESKRERKNALKTLPTGPLNRCVPSRFASGKGVRFQGPWPAARIEKSVCAIEMRLRKRCAFSGPLDCRPTRKDTEKTS